MAALDTIKIKFNHALSQLDKELSKYPYCVQFQTVTKIPKTWVVLAVIATLLIFLFFNIAGPLITNFLGWFYPAFASFQALETKDKEDDVHWLTYWVVFGFVTCIEYFSSILLYYIPFYYILKSAFLFWLFLPQFRGAQYLYITIIRPYLRQNTSFMGESVNKAKTRVSAALKDLDEATSRKE